MASSLNAFPVGASILSYVTGISQSIKHSLSSRTDLVNRLPFFSERFGLLVKYDRLIEV